ncbi:MAG: thioredoxin family protein [Prevotellaceae bacterium]|jgi:thiol:disulfide interchange protein|nr:thioredoxin family protein [Prevotellaceae bacterium]
MRKFAFFCFFVFYAAGALQAQALMGIRFFEGTLEQALKQAAGEKKIVFVDAYASWCGPCKAMSRNVFTNYDVGVFFNANFISLKVDWEGPQGIKMHSKYPLRVYPTLLYIDSRGELLAVTEGYQDAAALVRQAQAVVSKTQKK